MSLLHILRSVALALMLAIPALVAFTPPAAAVVIQGQSQVRTSAGLPEQAWPAVVAHAAVTPAGGMPAGVARPRLWAPAVGGRPRLLVAAPATTLWSGVHLSG